MKKIKKVASLLLIFLLTIPVTLAYGDEGDYDYSVTIEHRNSNKPIENSKFKLYYIGTTIDGKLLLDRNFKDSNLTLDNMNGNVIEAYIKKNEIKNTREEITNEKGIAKFAGLSKGIYFIQGPEESLIKTKPFIVSLPRKSINGEEEKNIVIKTKTEEIEEYIDLNIEKIWINDEDVEKRPSSIKVNLYKNDEIYDSVTLNEKNKWNYTWKNLEGKYNWTAVEKDILEDYEVSYEKYGTKIKIKNTYKDKEVKPEDETLPQTGSPWLIAQGLALGGIVLVGLGYTLRKRNE
ncbi:MAG: Cna B-type domain-containing protein [Clostridium sp.]|uniref:Cna B-type domain-containing protein n=1 Tax=Clostridium sp. TaxID=1506 RepID=UPI003EE5C07C